ncbi:lipocalin [Nocardia sp. SYP-A9097]|uniref:lipocalin family protein n=1 Tax=Nocardia sp. SYP-A9097 TaxID=2663237 RepID=UPI00129A1343|nr:lipocalin family protein [Nocardia sp. SYP-A9097]MRH87587.1 lipocalin [Nocardia sp. SYP-A9097]
MNVRQTQRAIEKVAVAAALAVTVSGSVAQADPLAGTPPAPVASLDLERYLGTWNQLAAVPEPFSLACAHDTQARYTLDPAGNVTVDNICTTWSGAPNRILGTAKVTDPSTDAQLHVSFPGVPTQDQLDGPPNYIVTALDTDYSWSLVTDPARLSGFVLSRTAELTAAQWDQIRSAITSAAGMDPCVYLTSPTTGGIDTIEPLCTLRPAG